MPATTRKSSRTTTTTRPDPLVAIALGGNLGPVEACFERALGVLSAFLSDLRVAPLYRSAALSPIPQPDYLNTVAIGRSALDAESLLAIAKALERAAGRRPGPRFSPRPLDLDLLLHGDRVSSRSELTLPHPRLLARRFVLAPLADLVPTLALPPGGEPISRVLERLPPERLERLDGLGRRPLDRA